MAYFTIFNNVALRNPSFVICQTLSSYLMLKIKTLLAKIGLCVPMISRRVLSTEYNERSNLVLKHLGSPTASI